jgi:hypothetical protein
MFSKTFSGLISLPMFFVFVLNTSCSLPLNENPPPPAPLDDSLGKDTACLSEVLPVMKGFMEGTARPSEVDATWTCFAKAIELFETSTRGGFEDRYTPRELANFFERYYLDPGTKLSDELLRQIFKLKQVFVGGSEEFLTREEMRRLARFALEMRALSLRLLPFMRLYTFNWKASGFATLIEDIRYFEAANLEIQSAARTLGDLFARNNQSYELENLVVLLKEVSALYGEEWDWLPQFYRALPLVYKLKKTLAGGEERSVAASEWKRFMLLGGRGYVQYLRYYYFISEETGERGAGPKLVYFARSIDDLFSYLGDMVGEKPGSILTRAEILEILQALSAFAPDLNPSDEFLIEAMRVKQLLFGGSLDFFKKEDFDLARSKVETFRALTEKFLSFADVYTLGWQKDFLDPQEAREVFLGAQESAVEIGARLGGLMEVPYDLRNISRFAEELEQLYPPLNSGERSFKEVVDQYLPLLLEVKKMMMGDQDTFVGKQAGDWSDFWSVGAKVYLRFLEFYYFLKGSDVTQSQGLMSLSNFVDSSVRLLTELVERRPHPSKEFLIPSQELIEILKAVVASRLLPDSVTEASLVSALNVILNSILTTPEERIQGKVAGGLSRQALVLAKAEFSLWYDLQQYIEVLFQGVPDEMGRNFFQIRADLERAAPVPGIIELRSLFSTPLPFAFDKNHQLYLASRGIDLDRSTMRKINLARALARVLGRSFSKDLNRAINYGGVTQEEMNEAYFQLRPLASDLGLVDPDNVSFANSRFLEANLFTPRGNGDDRIDFREISDIVLLILSGLKTHSYVAPELEKACPFVERGPRNKKWVDVECMIEFYQDDVQRTFTHLPEFTSFVGTLGVSSRREWLNERGQTCNPRTVERRNRDRRGPREVCELRTVTDDRKKKFFMNLLKGTGAEFDGQGRTLVSDVALIPHISQYIEAILQRFDRNKDGVLDTAEAMISYEVFGNILKKVSGQSSEKLNRAAFAWFLKYGTAPESISDKVKFIAWWVPKGEKGWNLRADRERLAQIMGFISDAIKSDKVKSASADELSEESITKEERDFWENESR